MGAISRNDLTADCQPGPEAPGIRPEELEEMLGIRYSRRSRMLRGPSEAYSRASCCRAERFWGIATRALPENRPALRTDEDKAQSTFLWIRPG